MTNLRDLARKFGAQPYQVAAYANLGWPYDETEDLTPEDEAAIRESWGTDPGASPWDEALAENWLRDRVTAAGYSWQTHKAKFSGTVLPR